MNSMKTNWILIYVVLFWVSIGCLDGCAVGWRPHRNKCYFSSNRLAFNWFDSLHFCHSLGGTLAVPRNRWENEEVKLIAKHSGKVFVWIGVSDIVTEGKWLSYPVMHYTRYTNWGKGEPNGGNRENCGDLLSLKSYAWNDENCLRVAQFICEKSK